MEYSIPASYLHATTINKVIARHKHILPRHLVVIKQDSLIFKV
jgi:hypothetical protein